MAPSFGCKGKDKRCQPFSSDGLGEVIEHLRREHEPNNVKRPNALGIPDSHGHLWYCFGCTGAYGKDHKSFGSDRGMWDHLNQCHSHWLVDIVPADEALDYWLAD